MTSVMIVHDIDLVRGALAAVLASQPDLTVVAQASSNHGASDNGASELARSTRPDVVVVHLDRCDAAELALPSRIQAEVAGARVLIVTGRHTAEALRRVIDAGIRGFISGDSSPAGLIQAIRKLAAGERVIDPLLLVAALRSGENPLSDRQRDVLRLAAAGLNSTEIGTRLFLSSGTVRNYLSAAIRQAGARNLLDAVERARKEGWI